MSNRMLIVCLTMVAMVYLGCDKQDQPEKKQKKPSSQPHSTVPEKKRQITTKPSDDRVTILLKANGILKIDGVRHSRDSLIKLLKEKVRKNSESEGSGNTCKFFVRIDDPQKTKYWQLGRRILQPFVEARIRKFNLAGVPVTMPDDVLVTALLPGKHEPTKALDFLPLRLTASGGLAALRRHGPRLKGRSVSVACDLDTRVSFLLQTLRVLQNAGAAYWFAHGEELGDNVIEIRDASDYSDGGGGVLEPVLKNPAR